MRIVTGDIGADAVLIEQADIIVIRADLDPAKQYAAVRALLPRADDSLVLALVEQVVPPSTPVPKVGLDSEV